MRTATITTDKGVMEVEFYDKDAPNTVDNFCKLSKAGFYNGLKFHRVLPDFVIQGGCPKGDGTSGPGYQIKCELDGENQYHDTGVLSMAHAGRDTGGSQFFICLAEAGFLNRQYTAFGTLIEGDDVLETLGNTTTVAGSGSEKSKPTERVGVESIRTEVR